MFGQSISTFKNHHWELQVRFIPEELDFVGRFEHMGRDVEALNKKLGITLRMPRVNTTTHGHYSTYYTPELRKIVDDIFAEDISRFEYVYEDGK